jgi:HK97 gp10 family phage protein
MANTIDIKVQGLKELQDALREFEPKFQKNVLRGAVRAGSVVVADEAIATVPVLAEKDARLNRKWPAIPGVLRRSIRVMSTRVKTSQGLVQGGVKAGVSRKDLLAFYAGFVERGTKRGEGRTKAYHFMENALKTQAANAIEAFRAYAASRIEDALK